MADPTASVDSVSVVAQGAAAILTAVGSFWLGRYRTQTRAAAEARAGDAREREQLFNHYNELIQTTREMNHSLRSEVGAVRTQMHALQLEHAKAMAGVAAEHGACRVENERLKGELKHLKADFVEIKQELAEYQARQG